MEKLSKEELLQKLHEAGKVGNTLLQENSHLKATLQQNGSEMETLKSQLEKSTRRNQMLMSESAEESRAIKSEYQGSFFYSATQKFCNFFLDKDIQKCFLHVIE